MQDAADSDVVTDPLAANIAAEVAADDDDAAAAAQDTEEGEEPEVSSGSSQGTTAHDVIQPDQTVDTGSQHVLKVGHACNRLSM